MTRGLAAVVGLAVAAEPARAQWGYAPVGFAQTGYRSGFGFGFGGSGFRVAGGFSSFAATTQVYGPVAVSPWLGGWAPGYAGYGWGPPVVVQPVLVPVAVPVAIGAGIGGGVGGPNRENADLVVPREPDPPVRRADFVVVRPEPAAPRARPVFRDNQFVPDREKPFPAEVSPPANPRDRAAWEIDRARASFAAGWYGRAGEQLAAAAAADPGNPLPYFLLAQVRTARGEYAAAAAALRDAIKRAPGWPASGFRLREFYGPAADRFDAHLADLKDAAAAHPDDPTVQFVLGYHLWFLGERDEAIRRFRRAAGRLKDPAPVEPFLAEADGKKA